VFPARGVLFNVASALGVGLDVEGEGGDYDIGLSGERFENRVLRLSFFVKPRRAWEGWPR
jgi:hypothetical protein